MAPSRGSGSGGEEMMEDLSRLLCDLGLEAEGVPSLEQEACEGCAETGL